MKSTLLRFVNTADLMTMMGMSCCADGEYEVTFKEWWSGSWLETRYTIYDFWPAECWDAMVYEEDVKVFYEFMFEKFGNSYAVDFFKARTGVDREGE